MFIKKMFTFEFNSIVKKTKVYDIFFTFTLYTYQKN